MEFEHQNYFENLIWIIEFIQENILLSMALLVAENQPFFFA